MFEKHQSIAEYKDERIVDLLKELKDMHKNIESVLGRLANYISKNN